MVTAGSRRALAGKTLALGVIIAVAAGCSSSASSASAASSSSPATNPSYARYPSVLALLAQCAFSYAARDPAASSGARGLLASAQRYNAGNSGHRWLYGSTVLLVSSNDAWFTDWASTGTNFSFGGKNFGDWPASAAENDVLPSQVCGTSVSAASARRLYAQVYRNWPSMLKNNPWGT